MAVYGDRLYPNLGKFKEFISEKIEILEKRDERINVYDVILGTWNVSDQNIRTFLDMYNNVIKDGCAMHTYERANDLEKTRGLMIDLDIYQDSNHIIYTNDFLSDFIEEIYCVIANICGITSGHPKERVIVTRKTDVEKTDGQIRPYKDGIHILFPGMRMTKSLRVYIMNALKESCPTMVTNAIKERTEEGYDLMQTNSDPSTWIDLNASNVPTLLLGSQKVNSVKKPHEIAFTGDVRIVKFRQLNMGEFKIREFDDILGASLLVLKVANQTYTDYKTDHEIKKQEIQIPEDDDEELEIDAASIQDPEGAYLKKLLDILPPKYYDDYKLWYSVLCALSSVSQRYRNIGLWFSKKSKKFNKTSFEETWTNVSIGSSSGSGKQLTKRSIIYWAHKENPIKFQEISATNYYKILLDSLMKKSGKLGHGSHAELLYTMFSHKYVYGTMVDKKKGRNSIECWYEFVMAEDPHSHGEVFKWRADPEAIFLKKYIMNNYSVVLNEGEKYITSRIESLNSDTQQEQFKQWSIILKNFRKNKELVDDINYVEKIVKAAKLWFSRDRFIEKLDAEQNIIGVSNGIIKTGRKTKLISRHHEYLIMVKTEAAYIPYDPMCKAINHILKIFRQVYIEPDMCEYFWYLASTALDRRPITGRILFIIGSGSNGKTITVNFLQNTLGLDLCASMKMAILTGLSGKANEADSAFMMAVGKTLLLFDEGSGSDIINSEKVKNIINCNKQSSRDLFQSQLNFGLYANAISTSNHPPIIRSTDTDDGFWRRLWFYRAKAKFTNNPDPNRKHEFPVDKEIETKLVHDPVYINATLSILTRYYEKFISEYDGDLNKIPCETLVRETAEFREQQDRTLRYCYSNIIISPRSSLSISELGMNYSNWALKFSNENITALKAEEFLSSSHIGRFKTGYEYIGIRLKDHKPVNSQEYEMTYSEYTKMTPEARSSYDKDVATFLQSISEDNGVF